jgi:GGDEF domain-containing protein
MHEGHISPPALNELMNRGEWHDNAEAQVEYAHKHSTPLSVMFADINFFKLINDTLGHDVGDDVIDTTKLLVGELASVLRIGSDARDGDMISLTRPDLEKAEKSKRLSPFEQAVNAYGGYLGGDEYGGIAETDEVGIHIIAGRLREKFDELIEKPEYAGLRDLGVGISIGVATLKPAMTKAELLRAADEDTYDDKIRQLPPLTEEQATTLRRSKEAIEATGMRIRDLIKYERYLNKLPEDELQNRPLDTV